MKTDEHMQKVILFIFCFPLLISQISHDDWVFVGTSIFATKASWIRAQWKSQKNAYGKEIDETETNGKYFEKTERKT